MISRRRFGLYIGTMMVVLALARTGTGQSLYSYVDEKGVRTFTNIPPTGLVRDLKVTGAPPAASSQAKTASSPKSMAIDPIIEKYAPQFQLDPHLVRSMISQESGFKINAVSPKGAQGLMQLMPATAARLGVHNSFDPEENIRGGMRHMRNLLDMFDNDLTLSLAAYNAGENLVQRIQRVPSYRETRNYVSSITARYGKKKHAPAVNQAPPPPPPLYRFTDGNGVLHLTNIPPVQRSEITSSIGSGSSQD